MVHPIDRIIAYVRYVPIIVSSESIPRYQKIYDLSERERYLKDNFSEYLWFSKTHERVLQTVPFEKVKRVHDPVKHMVQIRKNSSALSISTSRLVDLLISHTGINKTDIGVTGSQLIGIANETSDIDLIVFGESACYEFYRRLSESYDEIPGLKHYKGELLNSHVDFRWRELTNYKTILREIESKKILQGVFENNEFFIRLVKRHEDIKESYGQIISKNWKVGEVECQITDHQDSIFTPCAYQVESSEHPELKQIISYRGRFTEHVSKGQFVNVRGILERVVNTSSGEQYQQLVLGENSSDYMIPK
ncbi:hypothetical protein EU528_00400 [Candidatus Thorarchaeota archaeon]|nr:MAG: hypothetical protein EU528_00400 [Candidatus Thorarchaeota archaeon]